MIDALRLGGTADLGLGVLGETIVTEEGVGLRSGEGALAPGRMIEKGTVMTETERGTGMIGTRKRIARTEIEVARGSETLRGPEVLSPSARMMVMAGWMMAGKLTTKQLFVPSTLFFFSLGLIFP